jgi:putative peptidoglycan lipid II flippase
LAEPTVETESFSLPGLRKGRAAGIVGLFTLIVAVCGYFREAVLAARFGVSNTMDAYFGAVFIPNVIYYVLVAGTLSPIFIPILLDENGGENRTRISETFSVVMNFVMLVLAAIVLCGAIGAPQWVPLLFSGFNAGTTQMAVQFVYLIFPAVLFLAVAGLLTSVLNGFHKFALPAVAPALSSITVIAAVLLARGSRAIYIVAIATAAGFMLQAVLLIPATASLGIRYRPILNFRHPAIRKLLRLWLPLFLYLAVSNVSLLVERNLASRLSAGAVSILYYALRLFTVPSNFLAAPLAIVAYPGFAREAKRDRRGELVNQLSRMFGLVIFLFVPITAWTILNALPMTRLLYEHGRFLPADSLATAHVLSIYSLGILANAVAVLLLRCYFAIEDTVTPLIAELVALVFFVVAAPSLARQFGISGLAAARSMTFCLVTSILIFVLWKRQDLLKLDAQLVRLFFPTAVASGAMGVVSWVSYHLLQSRFDSGNTLLRLAVISIVLLLSAGTFLAVARLFKLSQARQIMSTVWDLLPGAASRDRR